MAIRRQWITTAPTKGGGAKCPTPGTGPACKYGDGLCKQPVGKPMGKPIVPVNQAIHKPKVFNQAAPKAVVPNPPSPPVQQPPPPPPAPPVAPPVAKPPGLPPKPPPLPPKPPPLPPKPPPLPNKP